MTPEKFRRLIMQLNISKGSKTHSALDMALLEDVPPMTAAKKAGVSKQCLYEALARMTDAQVELTELEKALIRECPAISVDRLLEKYL